MSKNYDDIGGVWRTIGGRRVFIKNGQSLSEAMIESGKFKNLREEYRKDKEEKDIKPEDFADELQNADIGDWNNMNQAERDAVCESILEKAEEKYGDKLKDENFRKGVTDKLTDENFHTMSKVIEKKYGDIEKLSNADKDLLDYIKGEDRERQIIARDIAKELDPSLKNASETLLDKRASELMTYNDGEVLDAGEKPYTNRFGELERSTESLKKWRDNLMKTKEPRDELAERRKSIVNEKMQDDYVVKYKDGMITVTDKSGYEYASYGLSKENYKENPEYWKDRAKQEVKEELYWLEKDAENDPYLKEAGTFNTDYLMKEKGMSEKQISDMSLRDWEKQFYQWKKDKKSMNNALRRKAYEKYMKEHPNSKKTFSDFMK